MACPGCKSTVTRQVAVGKRVRVECAGCSRFVGWVAQVTVVKTEPLAVAVAAESGEGTALANLPDRDPPASWLYVSKRLDLEWLPNVPLWSALAIAFGSLSSQRIFYRLTANVLVWLEQAGDQLEQQHAAGNIDRGQMAAYLDGMDVVWAFAREHVSREAVARARRDQPGLPTLELPRSCE